MACLTCSLICSLVLTLDALPLELQRCTQLWSRRPFGVGLLVAGYDVSLHRTMACFLSRVFCPPEMPRVLSLPRVLPWPCLHWADRLGVVTVYHVVSYHAPLQQSGPHIYQVEPSANYFDCKSMAIGARSQSAKTYLERNVEAIANSGALL